MTVLCVKNSMFLGFVYVFYKIKKVVHYAIRNLDDSALIFKKLFKFQIPWENEENKDVAPLNVKI